MAKANRLLKIEMGTATIEDLAYWISERHRIYNLKEQGEPKPWTEDEILQKYKFTNAFRQLDKGTVALRKMLRLHDDCSKEDAALLFFNIVWYRLFNWYEHAENLGFVDNFEDLENYINERARTGKKIFTGAHMTTGVAFEDKHESYLRACRGAWDNRLQYSQTILDLDTMESAFLSVLSIYMVGKFVAYELVCDFRFTSLLDNATDKLTWANMGPGAQRGLRRLGMPHKNQAEGLESMRKLYRKLNLPYELLSSHVFNAEVPFELREVEHSLCEFDKYQRVKRGEGRPRGRYNGMAD